MKGHLIYSFPYIIIESILVTSVTDSRNTPPSRKDISFHFPFRGSQSAFAFLVGENEAAETEQVKSFDHQGTSPCCCLPNFDSLWWCLALLFATFAAGYKAE